MRGRLTALVLALAMLCAACSGGRSGGEGYTLWFAASQSDAGSAALASETRSLSQPDAQTLLELLLAGPADESLLSPFPAGVALRELSLEGNVATVDLSEGYGGLSGVELTLADACVTLTLCQLEGIDAVYFEVEGAPRPFRDQVFTPDDFLLDNTLPTPLPT